MIDKNQDAINLINKNLSKLAIKSEFGKKLFVLNKILQRSKN